MRKQNEYVQGFGERLGSVITEKGLTDREVSRMIGLTDTAVCNYINYGRMPSCLSLKRLAGVLGVSTDYLLGVK